MTSKKDQRQYWNKSNEPYRFITVKEFANAFHSFHVGRRLEYELSVPFDKSKNHPAALTKSRYGISKKELLKACFEREFLLMKRNSFVYIFKLFQVRNKLKNWKRQNYLRTLLSCSSFQLFVLALISMTVFFRTKMHHDTADDGSIYMGALFVGLLTHLFNGFAELAMSIAKLPVFYKQRDLLFFPAWAYSLPAWILKIPISFLECGLWVGVTYYVIGFDPNVER